MSIAEALLVMHRTLREMPGPHAEMTALATRWDPAAHRLALANCGHVPPVVIRSGGEAKALGTPGGRGLGGRAQPNPAISSFELSSGDRLVLVSDGVVGRGEGKAGLGMDGLIDAARRATEGTGAETVRKVHTAVLAAAQGDLKDDATAVCLAVA
jgi:serine phosphatase RsbU (regulator of sigma subunit)